MKRLCEIVQIARSSFYAWLGAAETRAARAAADAELAALQARVAALETENAELMIEQTKLATERDILRQAAKYFAGETHS